MNNISAELLALASLLYVGLLFFIAWHGDRVGSAPTSAKSHLIYSLSLAVYCSSWTFFGAVGTASSRGWDFFAIYLGPILLFLLGQRLLQRIIRISKQHHITSISDFISSRYGKSRTVAVLVTLIAVLGSLPYISLQLQAIAMAFGTITSETMPDFTFRSQNPFADTAFYSAVMLMIFTILFGTRHLNATEHHRGLIRAIALESIVKLVAILAVGLFCLGLLFEVSTLGAEISWLKIQVLDQGKEAGFSALDFLVRMILSMSAILLLPRQFHVMVVEADNPQQVRSARWLFPIYLILISIAVIPIAIAGNLLLPENSVSDLFILNLPLSHGESLLVTVVFIGGISAATGMVIVAAISLSTMVSNDIVMPILIHIRRLNILHRPDLSHLILSIRRFTIALILLCSYGYYWFSDTSQGLADIGLISFAAIMLFAPAALLGLYWRGANRGGTVAGLLLGFCAWTYCLLLPTLLGPQATNQVFAGAPWLHPNHLFGLEGLSPLAHGVFWCMILNLGGVLVGSVRYRPSLLDKIQASLFLDTRPEENPLSLPDGGGRLASILDARTLCQSILGEAETNRIFVHENAAEPHQQDHPVSQQLVHRVEQSIASVIGASSARHIVAKTLLGRDVNAGDLMVLMDETSQAITFNRELLQSGFENISQGIRIIDREQKLVAWNSRYVELFEFPQGFLRVGQSVEEVLQFNAKRSEYDPKIGQQHTAIQMKRFHAGESYTQEWQRPNRRFLRSHGNPMPGGGFVTSYTDITEAVHAEELLRKTNESLEQRVMERTRDLEKLNQKIQEANEGKTRFLAAASHDLLQPINAARLFNQNILEQSEDAGPTIRELTIRVDRSLVNADRLLRALLDISKLDAGSMTPKMSVFDIYDLLDELMLDMEPMAHRKNLRLNVHNRHIGVYSDRGMLRSMMQNLIANAIRYTARGGVLIGCRPLESQLHIGVWDTGIGIRQEDQERIFHEFQQISGKAQRDEDRGLGLGLAIVRRLSRILNHPITVRSEFGRGSCFTIIAPIRSLTSAPNAQPLSWSPNKHLRDLKILCLEDTPDVLEALTALLQHWGCQVAACPNLTSARSALARETPTVIIADYNLEEFQTGLDFLKQAVAAYPSIHYRILTSADQDLPIHSRALMEGIHFLAKPVDPASLRSLLQRAVAGRYPGDTP